MTAALRTFITAATTLVDAYPGADLAEPFAALLAELVATDDWLAADLATPDPRRYQQYLLYRDPLARFSLVSFVWGAGQQTPVHDHMTWGAVGMLRGAEISTPYALRLPGEPMAAGVPHRLEPGDVEIVGAAQGEAHRVANAYADRTSISIHVYGADIGMVRRHVYDPATGAAKPFVSGYASAELPDLDARPAQ